jgi:DNA-binding transcriptional ArsR family regulator
VNTADMIAALAALAHETRLAVHRLLVAHAPEGLTAGEVAARLGIGPASLSFHLKAMTRARLIVPRPAGRFVWYVADLDTMNGVVSYLTENCCQSSAVCDPRCVPKPRRIAPVTAPRPNRRRSA